MTVTAAVTAVAADAAPTPIADDPATPAPAAVTTSAATADAAAPVPAPAAPSSSDERVAPADDQSAPVAAPSAGADQPAPAARSTGDDAAAVAQAPAAQQAPVDPAPIAPPAPPAVPSQAFAAAHAPTLPVRADHVRAMLRLLQHRGQVQAQLSLHPAELGGVEVRLRQTAHGLMATVTADRPEAAQVLQQAGTELRRALEAQGVQVAGLDIGMAGENQDAANARANERRAESALAGPRHAGDDNEPSPIDPDHRTTTASTIALGALVDVLA